MDIPNEWLTERAESAPTSYHESESPIVALRVRVAWQKLKRLAGEGDELWAFSSPPGTWKKRSKYVGYAVVRNGAILQSTLVALD